VKPKDDHPATAAKLRARAEATLLESTSRAPQDAATLTPEATRKLLHEMQVHQIELEMQNEELRGVETALDASRARYFDLYDLAPVGYCTVSEAGLILQANLAAATLLGVPRVRLAMQPLSRFIAKADQDTLYLRRKRLDETGEAQSCELRMLKHDGTRFWGHLAATAGQEDDGTRVLRVVLSDISDRKEHESQLDHIAHYDVLTKLPNRALLADRLRQGMAQALRRGQTLAVAYLDLDGFKAINDKHGHDAGDQLLIVVAARMKQVLRDGDTLARLSGDEFIAVLIDLKDTAASVPMFSRLLAAASQPMHVGELVLQVSASLGATYYPQTPNVDANQLLRQSDQAMYKAKLAGKNRYHVFDADQDSSARGDHESLDRIRHALAAREFVLYYQPKVNMRTGAVIGAEALIRWQHPERGLLLPAKFLPVIENHPLAVEVGEWVIDTVLTQMAKWRVAGLDLPVSVNVGARQLQQADFALRLREMVAEHPEIMPCCLELEVMETSALEDLAQVSRVIESCREIGVVFALDDFGTGYSSLTYLKRLAVTQLKIDQSFVCDMLDDPDDLVILDSVLGLASAFRRQVIAEGVETVEHGETLLQLGCELAQGFGIARPMPAADLPAWSATWRTNPAWLNRLSVSRDSLPLILAGAEHRAWVASIGNYLKGEGVPPPPDHQQCRFGTWLDTSGHARHGAQPTFQFIELLHRQVHALALALCELHDAGQNSEALTRLCELHDLRDAFLEQLKALVLDDRRQA
jgi:diguanylate cyclase (GGDEF)-like protein/PAS domain S-box-containing protein